MDSSSGRYPASDDVTSDREPSGRLLVSHAPLRRPMNYRRRSTARIGGRSAGSVRSAFSPYVNPDAAEPPPTPPNGPFSRSPTPEAEPGPSGARSRVRSRWDEPPAANDVVVNENAVRPSPPTSPDSTCPICLSAFDDKAKSDSCMHNFCFTCLVEWARVSSLSFFALISAQFVTIPFCCTVNCLVEFRACELRLDVVFAPRLPPSCKHGGKLCKMVVIVV